MGETVVKKLFGGQDALGEKIRLENISCEIIAILMGKRQSSMGTDQDDIVVIPLSTSPTAAFMVTAACSASRLLWN